jgi:tRNA nucleotidyltransferase/poly(A) polymerase
MIHYAENDLRTPETSLGLHRFNGKRGKRRPRCSTSYEDSFPRQEVGDRPGLLHEEYYCPSTTSSSSSPSRSSSSSSVLFIATTMFLIVSITMSSTTRAFTLQQQIQQRQSLIRRHPTITAATSTRLNAMDSRQLRFLGGYSKRDEEQSSFPFSTRGHNRYHREDDNQRMYSEFIQQYVSGSTFWSSVMSGTTQGGILSQATAVTSNKKIWKQQVTHASGGRVAMAAGSTTTATSRFASTSSSSSSSAVSYAPSSSSKLHDGTNDNNKINNFDRNNFSAESNSAVNSILPVDDDYPFEPKRGYGPYIPLSPEERELFRLLRQAREEMNLTTTLRVAGGWVRDKLLATPEFARTARIGSDGVQRLTSKYKQPSTAVAASMGRQGGKVIGSNKKDQQKKKRGKTKTNKDGMTTSPPILECQPPVDIDIALDDMLGREYAEHLNHYLGQIGEKTHGVGVILQNPEKSKHLETATMKVGTFWIDFVNLRAEEYTQDSRIPDLMRIGSPAEDSFRRDLTINSLFYNVNNGQVEDWTGRGFEDLRRGVVSTPLAPLTTLLDDPLRALRSVRFAARLRFTMDDSLIDAAMDDRVRQALAEKVSRERIGCEVDLMLRSPDPVGAMRLLIKLNLSQTVFPFEKLLMKEMDSSVMNKDTIPSDELFQRCLDLLSTTYGHLEDCKIFPPVWCQSKDDDDSTSIVLYGLTLNDDDEARRYLWYASFLKPLHNFVLKIPNGKRSKREGKKANRSVICKLLVDELKRPTREAETVEKIIKGAEEFKRLMNGGCDLSAVSVLLSDIQVKEVKSIQSEDSTDDDSDEPKKKFICMMNGKPVYCATETDPVWQHAMSFRRQCSEILRKVGPLWRAALFLAMSEHITDALEGDLEYVIEGDVFDETQDMSRQREIDRYDAFATAMQRLGLIGIWNERPLLDGGEVKKVLPNLPKGPAFREVMDEQEEWTTLHPGAGTEFLVKHLQKTFPNYS